MTARTVVALGALAPLGILATACGTATASAQHTKSAALAAAVSTVPPSSAKPAPTAAPVTPAQPVQQVIVVANNVSHIVKLLTPAGNVVATGNGPSDAPYIWTVTSGGGAAWWLDGAHLVTLDASGTHNMATVPSDASTLSVSPDGKRWLYATATSPDANNVSVNAIYSGGIGLPTTKIAQRTSDPAHVSPDAPSAWVYALGRWTIAGVVIERWPTGGCGCGIAFDMQMSDQYSALIDPATGSTTELATTANCPLSGMSDAGLVACFHSNDATGAGASDKVEFFNSTGTVRSIGLSGTTVGGAATFLGSNIAYATIPTANDGGCGGPDWHLFATLRVMDIASGTAHALGHTGFVPRAWLRDGTIAATSYTTDAKGDTLDTIVDINPTTGASTTVLSDAGWDLIGVA